MDSLTHALDSKGNLVFVDDVATGLACDCICPCCKGKLLAKNKGEINSHHFAHAFGPECEGARESMLHLLAKEKVRNAFLDLENKVFNLQFEFISYCPKTEDCGLVPYGDCHTKQEKTENLKKYYDSCEPEIVYDNIHRRSDLKFFSSTHPEYKPLYIEFYVTHASEESKLHSGEKIVEVKIESVEDIDKIVAEGFTYKNKNISFYGLKTDDYKASIGQEVEFSRYILYSSGKTQCYQDSSLCNNIKRAKKNSLFEICFHTPVAFGIYDMAKYQGYKRFGIKNCILCDNYVERYDGLGMICRKYYPLGISKNEKLDTARAKECRFFRVNEKEMEEELKNFESSPLLMTVFE